jgi:hypothetical protein
VLPALLPRFCPGVGVASGGLGLRGRTRAAGSKPAGPHHLAAPEISPPGGPAVSGQPCRGAGHPGRGHPDPPGADRVLRLPVLRVTATRRGRRAACQLLHPGLRRLGTADTHRVPPPIGACPGLATARHANRAASNTGPKAPSGRSRSPRSVPASSGDTCGPSGAPQTGGCSRAPAAPAQRKPLRPDLAPGRDAAMPQDGQAPSRPPPPRPAPCRAVAVAGLRRPARRDCRPRRAQRACPAHHRRPLPTRLRPDRQPAHRASPPPQPMAPRWPTTIRADAGNPVRHTSAPQCLPAFPSRAFWRRRPVRPCARGAGSARHRRGRRGRGRAGLPR